MMPKRSFIKRIQNAVTNFSFSRTFINEPTKTALNYFMLLILCIAFVQSGVFALKTVVGLRALGHEIDQETPYFELKNGILSIEMQSPFIFEIDKTYIVIDPLDNQSIGSISDLTDKDILLINSTRLQMKNQINNGREYTLLFEDFPIEFTKNELVNLMTQSNRLPTTFFVISFLLITIGKLFGTFLAWVIASLSASLRKAHVNNGQTYILGIYALTLPSFVKSAVKMSGHNIPYFTIIYYTIVLIYIVKYLESLGSQDDLMASKPFERPLIH